MGERTFRSLVCACAAFVASTAASLAEIPAEPIQNSSLLRIREAFSVDGIALFDSHSQHAARVSVCAASVFAGLKWCVTGTAEETKGEATYVKTTGYNLDAESRIVYAISTRRGYPLRRDGFDTVIQSISSRFGASASVYSSRVRAAAEAGDVDSQIAVWGSLRLVQLSEAEYAVVESGASLKRGHLVDHRFNLVASAKLREPIYKVEGDAGYILHLSVSGPGRADVVARAIYPPAFVAPSKPSEAPATPLSADAVKPPKTPLGDGSAVVERERRVDAERGLAAERLLREEAEKKADEAVAARAEAERKLEETQRALEELKRRSEADRKDSLQRAEHAEAQRKQEAEERRREEDERQRREAAQQRLKDEADRKAAEERRRAEDERQQREAAQLRLKDEADRKAAEARRLQDEAERKIAEARRLKEEAERRAAEQQRLKEEAERKAADEQERRLEEVARRRAVEERQMAEERRRMVEAERNADEERMTREEVRRFEAAGRRASEKMREEAERGRAEEAKRAEDAKRAAAEAPKSNADQGGPELGPKGEEGADAEPARPRASLGRKAEAVTDAPVVRTDEWYRMAEAAAAKAGVSWSFGERQGRGANERVLTAQAIFSGAGGAGVEIVFECSVGQERRLRAWARGFDRNSGARLPYSSGGEGAFRVSSRISIDAGPPRSGTLTRDSDDDVVGIAEVPLRSEGTADASARAAAWLRHYTIAVDFNLMSGTVTAAIAPYGANLRRVLEACAQ